MHIVVIGLGEVGRHLLDVLDGEGHDVVAIDQDPAHVAYAEEHFDVATMVGYGASQDTLDAAGVAKADLVVAVTNHDEVNLIAALAAKRQGANRVIARAQGTEWARWTEGVRYGLLGVDVVINPRVLVAQELAKIARSHGASEVIDLAQDRIELVQLELSEHARHTGKPLMNVPLPRESLVAAVVRDGRLFIPGGTDVLLPKDRVYLLGRPQAVVEAEDLFTTRREARRVVIVGGGVIGEALARHLLADRATVMVIEKDRDRAIELSALLPGTTVVHGDGTDLSLLEEEEVGSYDLFAAVTPLDEVNLMAALLAQRVQVPRTACVVQRGDYMEIYRKLGIDIALSPRVVASDHILRFSRTAEVHSLTVLENGQAEVVEVAAMRGCRVLGVPLKRMNLPRGALLGAIVHEDQVVIPRGDDEVRQGDTVILLTTEEARPTVERLFRPKAL
jgi:trk system potassium uptake protein TrkA